MGGQTLRAAGYVVAGMALFALIDNFIRLAAPTGGLWQFQVLRSVGGLGILIPFAFILRQPLRPLRPGRVAVRSGLTALAMVVYFASLGLMPIAQAAAGLFTAPIWVVLISTLVLGDRIGPRRIAAVAVGFTGIVLALRPGGGSDLTPLTLLPVLAGALYGTGNILTRRWCGNEGTVPMLAGQFVAMLVWGALGCAVLWLWPQTVPPGAAGWAVRGWVVPDATFAAVIAVQAVGSLIGIGLTIRAYQLADTTVVAVFENANLLFATAFALILWGERPTPAGLAGLAMIVAAGIIIAVRSDTPQTVRTAPLPDDAT